MALNAAVITVEGVLQKVVTYAPIPSGICLYHGLSSVYNVLLVTDSDDEKYMEHWLDLENLNKHGTIIYNDSILATQTPEERRLSQVNILRSRGFAIDMVVEPDPRVAARLLGSGLTVLNYIHSSYALPQWRPDYERKIKPWEEISKEMDLLTLLKAQDARLREEEDEHEPYLRRI